MDAAKIQEVCRPKTFQTSWEVTAKQIPKKRCMGKCNFKKSGGAMTPYSYPLIGVPTCVD